MSSESKYPIRVVGKTKAGKELGYREVGHNRYKEAAFKGGGQVPEELKGVYTDPLMLEKAIHVYLAKDADKKTAKKSK